MASTLCLPSSPFSLLQRPSKTHNLSHPSSPCINFSRLFPIRGALNVGRLQITRGLKIRKRFIVRMAPEGEKLTRRNPLDFPSEWDRPRNPRRPDIFPQFSPTKTPLPPPMPFDPPLEDDEEEEERREKEEQEQQEQEQELDEDEESEE